MGYSYSAALAEVTGRERALVAHLQFNCFPEIPTAWAGPALEALALCDEGDHTALVDVTATADETRMTPRNAFTRDGRVVIAAADLVSRLRIGAFLQD